MKLGFTGTRDGITHSQDVKVRKWLQSNPPLVFHHGACVGADAAVALTVRSLFGHKVLISAHLGDTPGLTSSPAIGISDTIFPSKKNLARNRDIVGDTDVLLACPKGPEELRSGTWSTIRFAQRIGRRVVIVYPDGRVEDSAEVVKS